MNGQLKSYKEMLDGMAPVSINSPRIKIDYAGLCAFAAERGVQPAYLEYGDKLRFISELAPGEINKIRDNLLIGNESSI